MTDRMPILDTARPAPSGNERGADTRVTRRVRRIPHVLALGVVLNAVISGAPAIADEAVIQRTLQARFPTMKVESVSRSPFAGLYEVVLDGEIVYTDEKAEYFFGGNIYDIRTLPPRNLTQERTRQLTAKALLDARDLAIKRVRGAGERTLFTFEDPNCGYCKALQRELAKMDNVTVFTFLLPLLSRDSFEKSVAVWCADDRAGAWEQIMTGGALPGDGKSCAHPLSRIAAIARRFQVQATPAIFLGNGVQIGGMRSAADIEKALGAVR